jgi:hypothetical protein
MRYALLALILLGCGATLFVYTDPSRTSTLRATSAAGTEVRVDYEGSVRWFDPSDVADIVECGVGVAQDLFGDSVQPKRYDDLHIIVTDDQTTIDNYYWFGFSEERRTGSAGAVGFILHNYDNLTPADSLIVINGARTYTHTEYQRGRLLLHEVGHTLAHDLELGSGFDSEHKHTEVWDDWFGTSVFECLEGAYPNE